MYMGVLIATKIVYNINRRYTSVVLLRKENRKKMSFGINGPSPMHGIQEAQSMRNNGGGGNLGYFQRRNKKGKQKENEIDVFQQSIDENDVFIPEEPIDDDNILKKASEFIKQFKKPRRSL